MKQKVVITRKLPKEASDKLREMYEVDEWPHEDAPIPRDVLKEKLAEASGLLCLLTEEMDEEMISCAKNLKVISNMAAGYNNIDIAAASKNGIAVTNTPGVLTETTADLTFALLMATARRIPEAENYLKNGEWKTWSPMQLTGQDVFGATLGIIGLGRIGESVAKRAKGFDMKILYHNRSRKPESEKELGIEYTDFQTLLTESDFVCIMTPLTPQTKNLIGEDELALMKETSILLNTARGGIVDEKALYQALANHEIWAAGLDVFEKEPIELDHPLLTLPNVVTLPHIGSASIKTRKKMADLAVENLTAVLEDRTPRHLVTLKQEK
ncbi:2-hydroxyacid dehydrogenase [Planococcus sp. YIM B11945]|uniref:2-hydroxyacid dehydrogenase n=1 Tax=Planococcus sp. YIM B11945 TaxID=3435410 RepID=UPI003D7C6338